MNDRPTKSPTAASSATVATRGLLQRSNKTACAAGWAVVFVSAVLASPATVAGNAETTTVYRCQRAGSAPVFSQAPCPDATAMQVSRDLRTEAQLQDALRRHHQDRDYLRRQARTEAASRVVATREARAGTRGGAQQARQSGESAGAGSAADSGMQPMHKRRHRKPAQDPRLFTAKAPPPAAPAASTVR